MLLWQREMSRPGNLKLLLQLLIILTCLNFQRLLLALKIQFHGMTQIHKLLSMKMMTITMKKTLTGDCVDELDETAYTVGTATDDPKLLEKFDGNLEDADASASQVYDSASRSFQEARERLFSCCGWCF